MIPLGATNSTVEGALILSFAFLAFLAHNQRRVEKARGAPSNHTRSSREDYSSVQHRPTVAADTAGAIWAVCPPHPSHPPLFLTLHTAVSNVKIEC